MGYRDLVRHQDGVGAEKKQQYAALPQELARFDLDRYRDRPIQAEIMALLLLPKDDSRFTSCVLVHGMGGTGKVRGLTIFSLV